MKRLMIVPILALAMAAFAPNAQAVDPDPQPSGDACGTDVHVAPSVVGTTDSETDPEDWYDASFTEGTLTLEFLQTLVLSPGPSQFITIFEWDRDANVCERWVTNISCTPLNPLSPCFPTNGGPFKTITLDEPGDYQIKVWSVSGMAPAGPPTPYMIRATQ